MNQNEQLIVYKGFFSNAIIRMCETKIREQMCNIILLSNLSQTHCVHGGR